MSEYPSLSVPPADEFFRSKWVEPPAGVEFLDLPDVKAVMHSEEHLVVEAPDPRDLPIGREVHAIPWHVCPSVALHAEATVVLDGRAVGTWEVTARDR